MTKRPPNANEETEGFNADFDYPQYSGDEETIEDVLNKRRKTGGRAKGTPNKQKRFELQKTAQQYGLRALATVIEVMEDDGEQGSVRLAAAKELLDRGFGRAKQMVEVGGVDGEEIQHRLTIEFVGQPPVVTNNHAPSIQNFTVQPGEHLPSENPGSAALHNRVASNSLPTAEVATSDIHPLTAARMRGAMLRNQPAQAANIVEDAAIEQVVVPVFKKPWE